MLVELYHLQQMCDTYITDKHILYIYVCTILYATIEGDSYSIVVATVSDSMATVVALQLRMAQVDKLLRVLVLGFC